jgi:hypothetical protein
MKRALPIVLLAAGALALSAEGAMAQGFASGRAARKNAAGGVTAGQGRAVQGENGGFVGGRGFASDGEGNAAGASGQAFKGPNGAAGARAGKWSRSSDGSVDHQSGGAVTGAAGSASTSGSASRDAAGNTTASRNTQATSNTGATYDGSTTYESGSGASHSGTCTDSAGNVVACPTR